LGINSLARRTPTSALRSHRDRLEGGAVSEAELRAVERDFLAADVPFGQGVLALPFAIGAGVALVPAFDGKSTSDEQLASGIIGGILGLDAIFIALAPSLVPSYRNTVHGFVALRRPRQPERALPILVGERTPGRVRG
jgi:hypothetical protein